MFILHSAYDCLNHVDRTNHFMLQVTFSMLEIYNEQVRDLLVPPSTTKASSSSSQGGSSRPARASTATASNHGLRLRQNPLTGFYVQGLKVTSVTTK